MICQLADRDLNAYPNKLEITINKYQKSNKIQNTIIKFQTLFSVICYFLLPKIREHILNVKIQK